MNHNQERRNDHRLDMLDEAIVWLFFLILAFAAIALFAHYIRSK